VGKNERQAYLKAIRCRYQQARKCEDGVMNTAMSLVGHKATLCEGFAEWIKGRKAARSRPSSCPIMRSTKQQSELIDVVVTPATVILRTRAERNCKCMETVLNSFEKILISRGM